MLFRNRQFDPKLRRQIALGNLCLCVGLSLQMFVHPDGDMAKIWVHGVAGLLLGISIGVNLFAFRRVRCCREKQDLTTAP